MSAAVPEKRGKQVISRSSGGESLAGGYSQSLDSGQSSTASECCSVGGCVSVSAVQSLC